MEDLPTAVITIEALPETYSLERQFAAVLDGFTHLAYGSTPEECLVNLESVILKFRK